MEASSSRVIRRALPTRMVRVIVIVLRCNCWLCTQLPTATVLAGVRALEAARRETWRCVQKRGGGAVSVCSSPPSEEGELFREGNRQIWGVEVPHYDIVGQSRGRGKIG